MELVAVVYEIMKYFPIDEKYGLVSQTKRAVVSLPSNIAEGLGRNYKKDTIQFLHIARGSLYELDTLFEITFLVKFIDQVEMERVSELMAECLKLLNGLIAYYENSGLK
jgi:four helix bundle protein